MKLNHELCNHVFMELDISTKRAIVCIIQEMISARNKHPDWPINHIEAAAIVGKEAGELLRATLRHKYEFGQYFNMHKEAIQVGATAIRFLYNMPEKPLPGEEKDTTPLFEKRFDGK